MKMEKTPRYTQRERNMVLGFAARYKDIIENKRTDAESNRKKDEIWRQIAKEFNEQVYHQRSSKQLRQLYKNMKLLLKKDLCGEGKGNRSFMELLNTLSQQESVAQYISEQMSPSGGAYSGSRSGSGGSINNNNNNSRHPKYDDDYDDSKPATSNGGCGMDTNDVIVIKSEELSDNEQSQSGCNPDEMDEDDDDDASLSPKDIPEVCLEEEDDEIFATDLRQSLHHHLPPHHQQQQQQQQQHQQQQNSRLHMDFNGDTPHQLHPEITIQNIGGIRMANLKSLQNPPNNSALSINTGQASQGGNCNGNGQSQSQSNSNNNCNNNNNNNNNCSNRQMTPEQQAQQLLLNGLGLSAVHPATDGPAMPSLQRGGATSLTGAFHTSSTTNGNGNGNNNNSNSTVNALNALLMNLNNGPGGNYQHHKSNTYGGGGGGGSGGRNNSNANSGGFGHNLGGKSSSSSSRSHDYHLRTLVIEERQRKIDLLNAQIEYWKTLTKKLDANGGHSPMPACLCHFPGKVNGLQTPQTSSS